MEKLRAYLRRAHRVPKPVRIARVVTYLMKRARRSGNLKRRPMRRKFKRARQIPVIAYDLETTRIEAGTPRVLYITAHGDTFRFSGALMDESHLGEILRSHFLTDENVGARFVAWNGNNFDAFFVARALVRMSDYTIRPYLTRSKALRGMKVMERGTNRSWEFLDGISMIMGGAKVTLDKFLKTFAPDYLKLDAPDWASETFDARNEMHVQYAERDSEGLYHGVIRAMSIVREHFDQEIQPTIGNLGIRIFQQHLPESVTIWAPGAKLDTIIREHVLRGGYCYANKRYAGDVWKYDINQAYAAAMRDAMLPAGSAIRTFSRPRASGAYIAHVHAFNQRNRVPFYCTGPDAKKHFPVSELNSWLTGIEVEQLRRENWRVEVVDSYSWTGSFNQKDLVDKLERLRIHGPGGPKSAQGEMMKALGNNAYGKTVERLDGLELVMALECPEGFGEYRDAAGELENIWYKIGTPHVREYHQPQLGAFITAHVRMVLRRAILQDVDNWIYSDTDSVAFSAPVELDIDPGRYGAWKVECEKTPYIFIAKKIYAARDFSEKKWKGLSTKGLTLEDFERTYHGGTVEQDQIQRMNILNFMIGNPMYRTLHKTGMKIGEGAAPEGAAAQP